MDPYDVLYLQALAVTVVVEVPLVGLAAWRSGRPVSLALGVALGANLLTHGLLWTVFERVPGTYAARVVALESAVVVAEAAIYAGFGLFRWRGALALSFGANLTTTAIGLVWM